jgi:potassium efflux system protein
VGTGLVAAFRTLGMSWTKFHWLMAALGVGLGFGLEEIVANFVSGIIILFERPFRFGDILSIGDQIGKVSKIRIRATTIVDADRREIIVPNKSFITGQLINFTLSDMTTRIRVPIGIAYGSDVALARQILLQVARDHELVLADPAPQALFIDFGESTLNLELRGFLANMASKLSVTDEINERIKIAFQQAGIEIVFPQRDVNLKTAHPVEVIMVHPKQQAPAD